MKIRMSVKQGRFYATFVGCALLAGCGSSVRSTTKSFAKDKFGISEIYDSKRGGEQWFMDMEDPEDDDRFKAGVDIFRNDDGSWKVTDKKVRLSAFTSAGYEKSKVVSDHGVLKQRKYMMSPRDWRNVEMTGYFKLNSKPTDDNFTWYARSGMHSKNKCEGTGYKPAIYYNGEVKFAKEQWHNKGYAKKIKAGNIGDVHGRWVGFKSVIHDVKEGVKLEVWVDINANNQWKKVGEYIDRGDWGEDGKVCDPTGTDGQIISWGGPLATFRWDGATDVDVKFLSVREIQP
jgi:hypothetical protein